jgi:hypothetical protein
MRVPEPSKAPPPYCPNTEDSEPGPSRNFARGDPTRVATKPAGVTLRMYPTPLKPPSFTNNTPLLATTMEEGDVKAAAVPHPPAAPAAPLPASVDVKPVAREMLRTRWLFISATYSVESVVGSSAVQKGWLKVAFPRGPFQKGVETWSFPASVATVPFAETVRIVWLPESAR